MRVTPWCGFRSLLCAVDFSEHSRLALQYATALAARRDTALTVLYANDPLLVVFGTYNARVWPVVRGLWVATLWYSVRFVRGQAGSVALSALGAIHWAWCSCATSSRATSSFFLSSRVGKE